MMRIAFLLDIFRNHALQTAIIWGELSVTYGDLLRKFEKTRKQLTEEGVKGGSVVILEGEFSPNSIALFLALIDINAIVVPLTRTVETKKLEFIDVAQGEFRVAVNHLDQIEINNTGIEANHELYERLRKIHHPGLALFSSGSTGKSKAAVHDMVGVLEKFKTRRKRVRAITFLLFDHIGGVNTLLYNLSNAGCMVTVTDRSPDTVLEAIERHRVELLPTSPTFINLILLSEAYRRHDLSSLRTVSYGTEPMPESTLRRFHELFPGICLRQMYGLSELGILQSKSKSSDSLWVKIGGEGFETRVVDGSLQIKAKSAMLGYLNAPSPFTADGWYETGDLVETDGEYFRFLGRKSEIINVGGEKVFPAEVESVLLEAENVADAIVFGEKNLITGNIVCAQVRLGHEEDPRQVSDRLKTYCRSRLKTYKVPVKISVTTTEQHTERFKKLRRAA